MGARAFRRALALAAVLAAAGCNGDEPQLAPVRGTVYYRGEPLRGGVIVFVPDDSRGGSGPMAQAEIGPDGTYTLLTEGKKGAVPGWHRITVAGPAAPGSPPLLPARYNQPDLSGQSREVEPGRVNVIDLHLD